MHMYGNNGRFLDENNFLCWLKCEIARAIVLCLPRLTGRVLVSPHHKGRAAISCSLHCFVSYRWMSNGKTVVQQHWDIAACSFRFLPQVSHPVMQSPVWAFGQMRVNFKNEANHRPLQETYEAEEAKSFIQKVKNMGFDVFFFFVLWRSWIMLTNLSTHAQFWRNVVHFPLEALSFSLCFHDHIRPTPDPNLAFESCSSVPGLEYVNGLWVGRYAPLYYIVKSKAFVSKNLIFFQN